LPLLENEFSQRVNAIVQKTREMRRGVYYPHLYIVKEDGEAPLRLWALSALIQDRSDVLPSYQQFLSSIREKVSDAASFLIVRGTDSNGSCRSMEAEDIKAFWRIGGISVSVFLYLPRVVVCIPSACAIMPGL
jgi:hypothetical protein